MNIFKVLKNHRTISNSIRMPRRVNLLYLTAAALSSSTQAWVAPPLYSPHHPNHLLSTRSLTTSTTPFSLSNTAPRNIKRSTGSRLHYSSRNKKDEDQGILAKIGKTVKSFLPTKWFGSDEEKRELARREEMKQEMSSSIDQMFKDAPLGIRMMGKMISPLMSGVASSLAETMAEQRRTTESLMEDARGYLMGDPAVISLLGEPIRVGSPFSQSSSTTSINGKTQTRIELGMPVTGSRGSGVARLLATQEGISQLQVEAGGRAINVSLVKRGGGGWSGGSSKKGYSSSDDNIIEAEIIEKKSK